MMTPVDAVRSGMGFDKAGHWHRAKPRVIRFSGRYGDADALAPVRGALYGMLGGALLWIGLILAAKALLRLV
jgi:hypothetical protein